MRRTREQSHHHWLPHTCVCIYADRSHAGTLRRGKDHTVDVRLSRSMAALCDVRPDALHPVSPGGLWPQRGCDLIAGKKPGAGCVAAVVRRETLANRTAEAPQVTCSSRTSGMGLGYRQVTLKRDVRRNTVSGGAG